MSTNNNSSSNSVNNKVDTKSPITIGKDGSVNIKVELSKKLQFEVSENGGTKENGNKETELAVKLNSPVGGISTSHYEEVDTEGNSVTKKQDFSAEAGVLSTTLSHQETQLDNGNSSEKNSALLSADGEVNGYGGSTNAQISHETITDANGNTIGEQTTFGGFFEINTPGVDTKIGCDVELNGTTNVDNSNTVQAQDGKVICYVNADGKTIYTKEFDLLDDQSTSYQQVAENLNKIRDNTFEPISNDHAETASLDQNLISETSSTTTHPLGNYYRDDNGNGYYISPDSGQVVIASPSTVTIIANSKLVIEKSENGEMVISNQGEDGKWTQTLTDKDGNQTSVKQQITTEEVFQNSLNIPSDTSANDASSEGTINLSNATEQPIANNDTAENTSPQYLAANGDYIGEQLTPAQQAETDAFYQNAQEKAQQEQAENTELDKQLEQAADQGEYLNQLSEEDEFIKDSLTDIKAEEQSDANIMQASQYSTAAFKQWFGLSVQEDWNDELWEKQLIGSAIDTAGHSIGQSFTSDSLTWEELDSSSTSNLQNAGISLVSSQLISEGLGIEFGSGLDGQVANTLTSQVAIETVSTAYESFSFTNGLNLDGFDNLSSDVSNLFYNSDAQNISELSTIGNAVGGIIGSYAARQVLNSNTEAEVIGSAVGATAGTMVGSIFGPVGSAISSYLGSAIGDTLGEKWNEWSDMDLGEVALDIINPVSVVNLVGNFVSAVFGGDEKPPEPEAEITLEYNPYLDIYEISSTYEKNGGKTEGIQGASDSLISSLQSTLSKIAGSGQIANRHELPQIEIGYEGKDQYIRVNGREVSNISSQGMQTAIGAVLKETVIEGGDLYVNRMIHSNQVSNQNVIKLLDSVKYQKAYDEDPQLKEQIDALLEDNQADIKSYHSKTSQLTQLKNQISELEKQIENNLKSSRFDEDNDYTQGRYNQFTDKTSSSEYDQDKAKLSGLKAKAAQLQKDINALIDNDQINALEKQIDAHLANLKTEITDTSELQAKALSDNHLQNLQQKLEDAGANLKQALEWQSHFNKTQKLNLQEPTELDDATRLEYEIIRHNTTYGNQPEKQFPLYETDLSDLMFEQTNGELTIYNRRGHDADTPLEELPQITLSDWQDWSTTDSGIKLDFTNRETGEKVELLPSIHQLMIQVNGFDKSLNGETPDYDLTTENLSKTDMTVNMAKTVSDAYNASGKPFSEQEALDLQFSGFGEQNGDTLSGLNAGDILLVNEGTTLVDAGSGDDLIVQAATSSDTQGGQGTDTISYVLSDAGVTVNLNTNKGEGGYAEGDTYSRVENVVGSHHEDHLLGNDEDNELSGLSGNDILDGGAGDDTLLGGTGDDFLDGGVGRDHLDGGAGNDTVAFSSEPNPQEPQGGSHIVLGHENTAGETVEGFANLSETDTLTNIENIIATSGDDRVLGNNDSNTLLGKEGNDRLSGLEGDDALSGGEGEDLLEGGKGNDLLEGGKGNDTLVGGTGSDLFKAGEGKDTVLGGEGEDAVILKGSQQDYQLLHANDNDIYLTNKNGETIRLEDIEQFAFESDLKDIEEVSEVNWINLEQLLERYQRLDEEERREQEDGGGIRGGSFAFNSSVFSTSMVAALSAQAQQLEDSQNINLEQSENLTNQKVSDEDVLTTETLTTEATDSLQAPTVNSFVANNTTEITEKTGQTKTTENQLTTQINEITTAEEDSLLSTVQESENAENNTLLTDLNSGNANTNTNTSEAQSTQTEETIPEPDSVIQETTNENESSLLSPLVTTEIATTLEDTSIPLNIEITGQNPNRESLEIYIGNLPDGATLSAGTLLSDGRYHLLPEDLNGLVYTPDMHNGNDHTLTIEVVSTELGTGQKRSQTITQSIVIDPVSDEYQLNVSAKTPDENITLGGIVGTDGWYGATQGKDTIQTTSADDTIYSDYYAKFPLDISILLEDNDGSEQFTQLKLFDLPANTVVIDKDNNPINVNALGYLSSLEILDHLPVSLMVPRETGDFTIGFTSTVEETRNGKTLDKTVYLDLTTDNTLGDDDTIDAGDGNNTIYAEQGDDDITSGSGMDFIYGGDGNDIIRSGSGDDVIEGGAGMNELYAGAGDDILATDGSDTVLDGGSGTDTVKLNGTHDTYDLTSMNSIERIEVNSSAQTLIFSGDVDADMIIGHESGETNKLKLQTTDTGETTLFLNMDLKDFLVQMKQGSASYNLIKNDNGNDELIFDGKYYELEGFEKIQFNTAFQGTDTLFLDNRNNNPFYLGETDEITGEFYEDGTANYQNYTTSNVLDLNSAIIENAYDIEDGTNLTIENFSGDHIKTNLGNGYLYAEQNYSGRMDFSYSIQDTSGAQTHSNNFINLITVDDTPIVEVTSEQFRRKYTYGFDSDTHYTLYSFNIIDPDTTWENIDIDISIASGGASKVIRSYQGKEYISGLTGYDEFNDEFSKNNQVYSVIASDASGYVGRGDGRLDFIRYGYNDENGIYQGQNMYSSGTALWFLTTNKINTSQINDVEKWLGTSNSRSLYDIAFNYSFNGDFKFGVENHHFKGTTDSVTPIILDLDKDGFDLSAKVDFDFNSDGTLDFGNWIGDAQDGILVYDWDQDEVVSNASEIAFSEYHKDANTDLEGLALAFDSNQDGVFNESDQKWQYFGVWQDNNLNGITDSGEFLTMKQMGISEIRLDSDNEQTNGDGFTIFGQGAFSYNDGSQGTFADVAFEYEKGNPEQTNENERFTDEQQQIEDQWNQLVNQLAANSLSPSEEVPLPIEETEIHDMPEDITQQ